ncbi:MAG: stage II sporulation protein E [bacterium]|jgi:stage II sporulation protein E|nr:stage II sporulation protein E [Bacillota bacterium]HHW54880.1 stage II sporulation protein E [Bacillota bacterium]
MLFLSLPGSLFSRRNALLSLVAFLVSRAGLFPGAPVPGLAFFTGVLAADRSRAPVVAFWSFLGFLSTGDLSHALQGGLIYTALFFLTSYLGRRSSFWLQPPFLALAVTLLGRALFLSATGSPLRGLLQAGMEGILVFVLSMIFLYGMPVLTRRGTLRGLDNEESVCLVILGAMVILGFSGLEFGFLSLGHVFGKYLVMLLALAGGAGLGAALGTAYGVTHILLGSLPVSAPGAYAFAGLLAGAFRGLGKLGSGLSFVIGDLLLSLYLLHAVNLEVVFLEGILALGLLLLTPSRYVSEVARLVPGTLENRRLQQEYDQRIRQVAAGRLAEVAAVFAELAGTLDEIAITERFQEEERLNQLFRDICQEVCEDCNLYLYCWEEDFYKTYRVLFDLIGLVEIRGRLEREEIPGELRRRCVRAMELVTKICHLYQLHRLNLYWQRRFSEKGNMVANQLRGVGGIVSDLAREINVEVEYREGLTTALLKQLEAAELEITHASVMAGGGNHLEINIGKLGCRANAQCSRIIRPLAERVCGRRLRLEQRQCALRTGGGQCLLRLVSARLFSVETGGASRARDGSSVSGDNYSVEELRDGRVALILSDGMGVGARAAEESATTIALLERLLNAGFNEELSLRTVNNILMLRSGEDSFATVDLVILDLYAGEAEFVKVGSCTSYIKRGRHVSLIHTPSPPIGIVEDIKVQPVRRRLRDGDLIVMVTDGVTGEKGKSGWLLDLLRQARTDEPEEMARWILAEAGKQGGFHADDMAALVARVDRED